MRALVRDGSHARAGARRTRKDQMAVDIQKLFNDELPTAMQSNPDAAKEIGATYQINVAGDDGGEWFIDCSDSGPKTESGNPGSADCTIDIASADFQKLVENPQANGMQLFFAGKLKVQGNQMLAMKLQKLFALRA
jgi:putative sterol carrier protein